MASEKTFYDKPLYTIPNYVLWFILGGLYFVLCNILLIGFYTTTSIDINLFNIFYLFIASIPFGPALGALYSSMGQIIREKDINFTSYFFNSYKKHFKSNLKLWIIELTLLTILLIDFIYFYINMPQIGLHIVFGILAIFVLILGLYAFPINCRFELKLKDLLILSMFYSIKKLHITLLKVAIIFISTLIVIKLPSIIVLLVPSVLCFLLTYYDKCILDEIECKIENK